jgi:hypothetical protein
MLPLVCGAPSFNQHEEICCTRNNRHALLHMQQSRSISENLQSPLQWASALLRLAIGSLFLCAAIVKTPMGIPGIIAYYSSAFEKSIFPHFLIVVHASLILFFEYGMALWLFSGFKLSLAWKAAALLLVSLAIGMIFAGKYDVAGQNYVYVFISVIGLLLSPFDRWVVGARA